MDLAWHKSRLWDRDEGEYDVRGFRVAYNDGPNMYMLYKDVFVRRIYHFESTRSDPLVLDCGSNIGMTVLYFKYIYPRARIVAFEPDPTILPYLRRNIEQNGLDSVELVPAAVSWEDGSLVLHSDRKYGSSVVADPDGATTATVVETRDLGAYLDQPVDFLKMNIEGAETSVIESVAPKLRAVRELVIEYHHLPTLPRSLHVLLGVLDETGFDYLVNDFDAETNPTAQPPFHLDPGSRYFLLVYARRRD